MHSNCRLQIRAVAAAASLTLGGASVWSNDVSVTPPAGSGFVIKDSSGNERLRVQSTTGAVTVPGLSGQTQNSNLICFDGPTGRLGPCASGVGGATGPTGNTGAQGAQGAQGVAGPTGLQGAQGVVGASGAQGVAGPAGPAGAQGLTGNTGAQGAQGVAGATGAQGAQGLLGATGATGAQGVMGPQGPQGLSGATGAQGATGPVSTLNGANLVTSTIAVRNQPGAEWEAILTATCNAGQYVVTGGCKGDRPDFAESLMSSFPSSTSSWQCRYSSANDDVGAFSTVYAYCK
jgi:hypothetical protein